MKKVKVFLVAFALVTGTLLSAAAAADPDVKTSFSVEITKLLEFPPNFDVEVNTSVIFVINYEGEIVVLSVDTENKMVENFLKNRLNYKKINTDLKIGKEYKVPIKITLES